MSLTEDLYELFLIDQQVRGLSKGLNAASAYLKNQHAKQEQLQRQLDELCDLIRHAEASAATAENEANSIEQRIQKLRDQMNSAKTNKEYSALLVEVNTIKLDKAKAEEQALQHMTRVDQLKAQREEVRAKLTEQQKLRQHAEQQLADRKAEVGDQLAQVKTKRESAARQLSAEALTIFEKLSESTDGEALAEVTCEERFADYHCGGCYMALPMERVNVLATTPDKIVRCPSCTRILYLATSIREALSRK